MMFDCSRGRCLKYFGNVCTPVNTVAARSRLRLEDPGDLVVPHVRLTSADHRQEFDCRSFRVCGPKIRNKLLQDHQSADTREQ